MVDRGPSEGWAAGPACKQLFIAKVMDESSNSLSLSQGEGGSTEQEWARNPIQVREPGRGGNGQSAALSQDETRREEEEDWRGEEEDGDYHVKIEGKGWSGYFQPHPIFLSPTKYPETPPNS